jgi:hypothetical protein
MDFEQLTSDQHDRIVGAGIDLMAAIADAFGPEEGQKIWTDLSDKFGDGIKHSIFMAMLSGRTSGSITVPGQRDIRDKVGYVEFIKIMRSATGFGLKEAKDFCDEVNHGNTKVFKIDYRKRAECVRNLRELGVIAT